MLQDFSSLSTVLTRDVYILAASALTGVVIAISLYTRMLDPPAPAHSNAITSKVREIIRQGVQYASLSSQDTNAFYALVHVNQALAYLEAASYICDPTELARITDVNVHALQDKLRKRQKHATEMLKGKCPNLSGVG